MDLRRLSYRFRDLRWMKLAEDRVQWCALVLAVLDLRVLLPESYLIRLFLSWSVTFLKQIDRVVRTSCKSYLPFL
jgi:hypothetical protein